MLSRCFFNQERGQSLIEYTMVIGLIMMVLFAMSPVIKRSTQGMIKSMADQIGNQTNADQGEGIEDSRLDESTLTVGAVVNKRTIDRAGIITYLHEDLTQTEEETYVNMGFAPDP